MSHKSPGPKGTPSYLLLSLGLFVSVLLGLISFTSHPAWATFRGTRKRGDEYE
jgi:hypothetical protein